VVVISEALTLIGVNTERTQSALRVSVIVVACAVSEPTVINALPVIPTAEVTAFTVAESGADTVKLQSTSVISPAIALDATLSGAKAGTEQSISMEGNSTAALTSGADGVTPRPKTGMTVVIAVSITVAAIPMFIAGVITPTATSGITGGTIVELVA